MHRSQIKERGKIVDMRAIADTKVITKKRNAVQERWEMKLYLVC